MARIHQALQRQSDQRWDMTVGSDDEGWTHAEGYCAGWRGDPDDAEKARLDARFGPGFSTGLQAEWDSKREFKDKFHTDGHATAEEANACYDQYQLDCEVRRWTSKDEQHKCAVCGAWTQNVIELGQFQHYHLCDDHSDKDHIAKVHDDERASRKARASRF